MTTDNPPSNTNSLIFKYGVVVIVLIGFIAWLFNSNDNVEPQPTSPQVVKPEGVALQPMEASSTNIEEPAEQIAQQLEVETGKEEQSDIVEPLEELQEVHTVEVAELDSVVQQETTEQKSEAVTEPALNIVEINEVEVETPKPKIDYLSLAKNKLSQLIVEPALLKLFIWEDSLDNFVVFIDNAANGSFESKYSVLSAPEENFTAKATGINELGEVQYMFTDENFKRYAPHAKVFLSLDAQLLVQLYKELHQELNSKYQAMGYPNDNFEDKLLTTIDILLATPIVDNNIELYAPSAMYVFKDSQLENLLPIQKLLIRMGPEQQKAIQAKLAEIKTALLN